MRASIATIIFGYFRINGNESVLGKGRKICWEASRVQSSRMYVDNLDIDAWMKLHHSLVINMSSFAFCKILCEVMSKLPSRMCALGMS